MHLLLLVTLSSAAFGQGPPVLPFAEAIPDIVLRGQSTSIVVKGRDLASLQSLKIQPADGVVIRSITPLASGANGSPSLAVEIAVDANAKLGERQLMLTVPANVTFSETKREGGDSNAQLDAFRQSIVKNQTSSMEAGSIYVNNHAVSITNVTVSANQQQRLLRITAKDASGDFAAQGRPGNAIVTGIQLVGAPDWIVSEARCGKDVYDSPITDAVVAARQGATATIVAQVSMEELSQSGTCELRVRVRDAACNTSAWFISELR